MELFMAFAVLLNLNIASWFILYQLIKQRGRLLLRLDSVERRLEQIEQLSLSSKVQESTKSSVREVPVGASLPDFRLPDLSGQMIGLETFRGQRVLLVHWNPLFDSCKLLASEFAKLQSEFHHRKARLALVSAQDKESNQHLMQEYGLECHVLLLPKEGYLEAFHDSEIPAAYLLDGEGRVISPLAVGVDQVLVLAREVIALGTSHNNGRLRSLTKSRIEREGLKAGTLAPLFNLPTIYGESVSLEAYRGRRVLLVFTSPHCAPCDYLAPHLVRLQRQNLGDHLTLVMVGRGDPEENRRKAELYGFSFPVALQRHWEISKLYGIFFTPVAFLIDEAGVIEKNVAKGVDEIMMLAHEALLTTTGGKL
ncbi:redoxin domain-containing protein [Candidatus Poribacteria bacterium]|nr:redoxin domain-containing protein [Candidatus Poribacteria bacterium]